MFYKGVKEVKGDKTLQTKKAKIYIIRAQGKYRI